MVKGTITVNNPSGLHMRPAAALAKVAGQLQSEIKIVTGDREVNPKSVLILMSAAIKKGAMIDIICEGQTEQDDLQIMLDTIAGGLGEEV